MTNDKSSSNLLANNLNFVTRSNNYYRSFASLVRKKISNNFDFQGNLKGNLLLEY